MRSWISGLVRVPSTPPPERNTSATADVAAEFGDERGARGEVGGGAVSAAASAAHRSAEAGFACDTVSREVLEGW